MWMKIIAAGILIESLVDLFFTAAPLQGIRIRLIRWTPWLDTKSQGHLFDCKRCVSVWFAAALIIFVRFADCQAFRLAAAAIIVNRLSNWIHLIFSSVRDAQINKRLERK